MSTSDLFAFEASCPAANASSEASAIDHTASQASTSSSQKRACGPSSQEVSSSKRGKWQRVGIDYPTDGLCPYCSGSEEERKKSKSNWARHVSSCHPEVIQEVVEAQSTQKQPEEKLQYAAATPNAPSKANRAFALYAATTTLPLWHVENKYLKEVLKKVPNFKVPDRRTLGKQIDNELTTLQSVIQSYLRDSEYNYSFGVDISTTKSMTLSFLGITAHVWSTNKRHVRAFGLDLTELTQRHTADYIYSVFSETLAAHKLTQTRMMRVVTDCGRNMLNAFYEPYRVPGEEPNAEDDDIFFVEREDDDIGLPMGLEEEAPEDEEEEDLSAKFAYTHNRNIKCAIHRLETCTQHLHQGRQHESLKKGSFWRVFGVISKFARSHAMTKELYEHSKSISETNTGLKPLYPATTRWSSLNITYTRVIKLRPSITKVCYDNGLEDISTNDYRLIENVLKITDPIRRFEKKLQQESVPTISLVYPGITGLLQVLSGLKAKKILPHICSGLQLKLRENFSDVLESGSDDSDPIYIVATCLDPPVALASSVLEDNLDMCTQAIKNMGKLILEDYDGVEVEVEEVPTTTGSDLFGFDIQPQKKKRQHLATGVDKLHAEIDEYRFLVLSAGGQSAAEFWIKHDGKLPLLARIARNVLSVPAGSSSVERLFSQMTMNSKGHKNRSGYQAIRRKSLFAFNEKYIHI